MRPQDDSATLNGTVMYAFYVVYRVSSNGLLTVEADSYEEFRKCKSCIRCLELKSVGDLRNSAKLVILQAAVEGE